MNAKQIIKPEHDYTSTRWYRSRLVGKPKEANWILRFFVLLLFIGCSAYIYRNLAYIPDPRLYFYEPASSIESRDSPRDWATYGGNLKHTRYVPGQPALKGKIRWSLKFSEATDSTPAVADGILYVGEYFKMHAINAATGESIWAADVTGPVHSSPAVAGPLLFFGLLDKRVIALERSTGELAWEFPTENYINGSPTVVGGVLYIGSADGAVYALDAKTGRLIWKKKSLGTVEYSPTVQDGLVYVATNSRGLYSLNARTGATVMHYRLYRSIDDAAVITNDMVYFISQDGKLYTIDHKIRELPDLYPVKMFMTQLWLMGLPVPTPTPQAGGRWAFSPVYPSKGLTASPAVTPKRVFAGDKLGYFYSVDPMKGVKQWQFKSGGSITTAPLALEDSVYFGSKDGHLYSLDQNTGDLSWKLQLKAPIELSPIYASSLIFVRTSDGGLHAIE